MDLLGDLELRPTGDRDLFEVCDPSLSLRGTDLSRDLCKRKHISISIDRLIDDFIFSYPKGYFKNKDHKHISNNAQRNVKSQG